MTGTGIIVAVTGGRHYRDGATVDRVLSNIHETRGIRFLLEGGSTGADHLAAGWCDNHGVEPVTIRADWDRYGHAAGPIRNAEMLRFKPDLLVAFPGGRGTADCVRRAKGMGIDVLEVWGRGEEDPK